jgi:nicotinate-nucleotide--dimethylbenzimidazole phosphoribosyltransferase
MKKLTATINNIKQIDFSLAEKTQKRLDNLTKPQGSLGRLEEIAKQVVEITGNENPSMINKVIFTLAGDHGITESGVSAYPKEVTLQMVYNFLRGGAGINVLAKHAGARVIVVDMGVASEIKIEPVAVPPSCHPNDMNFIDKKVGSGTKNMARGPAMTREDAVKSIENGIEAFEEEYAKGIDIIGTGDMGIGNTSASSAISSVITGKSVEDMTGKGTGIDDKSLKNKIALIKKAVEINNPDRKDAVDVLSKVGGFEIGGIAGVILAAAAKKIPVVIDGFISGAGALIAYALEPKVKDYMIAAHSSVEKGHRIILDYIGLKPLMDFDLRLGEGTGAALGITIVEASIKILTRMASFQEAGVSERAKE